MKRPPTGRRHLDTRTLLDYVEERLDAAQRAMVEDHLAGSCSRCRELLHELGRLVDAMRADRTPPVPAAVRARALEALGIRVAPTRTDTGVWEIARLLFDSLTEPLPAPVRRTVGEARWLRFALDPHVLELEAEPESGEAVTLRGRLVAPEPALYRIEIVAAGESLTAWPDATGRFAVERVPIGGASLTVQGPDQGWQLPLVDL